MCRRCLDCTDTAGLGTRQETHASHQIFDARAPHDALQDAQLTSRCANLHLQCSNAALRAWTSLAPRSLGSRVGAETRPSAADAYAAKYPSPERLAVEQEAVPGGPRLVRTPTRAVTRALAASSPQPSMQKSVGSGGSPPKPPLHPSTVSAAKGGKRTVTATPGRCSEVPGA